MLILTGRNGQNVQVYDSDDDKTEVTDFAALVKKLKGTKKLRVYGLKLYKKGVFYPPNSEYIEPLGVVIIPDEARAAMEKVRGPKGGAKRIPKTDRRKGVITVTLKNLHSCYTDTKHNLYINGTQISGWTENDVRQAINRGEKITMQ